MSCSALRPYTQSILCLTILVFIALALESSQSKSLSNKQSLPSTVIPPDQKRSMVGGYSPIDPKTEREALLPIAKFVLAEFAQSSSYETSLAASMPSLRSRIESNEVSPIILAAERQVVAGMNYRLVMGIMREDVCLGGFKVTVWRQLSGELKVTNWGGVLTCEEIEGEFGHVLNALRVENEIEGETVEAEPNS